MDTPSNPNATEAEEPVGCFGTISSLGLALYATLILSVAVSAILCSIGTLWQFLRVSIVDLHALTSGLETADWRLEQLKEWEIIGKEDLPQLYHDHSVRGDGSAGCLVLNGEIMRWDNEKLSGKLPLQGVSITSKGTQNAPTIYISSEDVSINCPFKYDEGGDRFLRMLRSEHSKNSKETLTPDPSGERPPGIR